MHIFVREYIHYTAIFENYLDIVQFVLSAYMHAVYTDKPYSVKIIIVILQLWHHLVIVMSFWEHET